MGRLFKTSVSENKQLSENHYLITLHPLRKIIKPKPGQFFMLSVDTGSDPLLRRPFSLHRWLGHDFQLFYRVVGKATQLLKDKKPGDILEIIGPLGNSFPGIKAKEKPIFVGGGLGIVPLFAFIEKIAQKKPLLFLGAKSKKEVLCLNALKSLGINPIISTNDGRLGQKGLITDVLSKFLSHYSSLTSHYSLYACGPKAMLREVSRLAKKYQIKGFMALEEHMACGIGACLSCVVLTKNGFKRVCKEGPVFPIEEIVW